MSKKALQIQHLNEKMLAYVTLSTIAQPQTGWVRALRVALGMSLEQLGRKLGITKQSMQDIEKREQDGSITIRALRETAAKLDMQLVYGFVPKDGSLEALIERKAEEKAMQIVLHTSNTMRLEDQENSAERIKKAIEEKKNLFKNELPKILWD